VIEVKKLLKKLQKSVCILKKGVTFAAR